MNRRLISAMACVVLTGGVSLRVSRASDETKTKKSPSAATRPAVAVNKICPVDRNNPVDPNVPTITYQGKVIGFCCEECVARFSQHAEDYVKDLQ